ETGEFGRTNGRPFEERQHILRIRGMGAFMTLILPYRKGQKRESLSVKREGQAVQIVAGDEITASGPDFYSYNSPAKSILSTFGAGAASANGMTAEGGPVEIVMEAERVSITAHGDTGDRIIKMPGNWKASAGITQTGNAWTLKYTNGEP